VRRTTLAALWLAVGVAVWNGFFDVYVSRGAHEYLQAQAEFELGQRPEPSMAEVMSRAKHAGVVAASAWAALIVACGWTTMAVTARRPRATSVPPGADAAEAPRRPRE
jgi:hypothetical protein